MISATVDGMSGSTQVEFSADGAAASARTIRMEAGSVAYSVERDVALGSDNATVEYKGLIIRATNIQVCQMLGQIRAQGTVTLRSGRTIVTADAVTCDLRTDRVRLLDSGAESSVRTVDVGKLKPVGTQESAATAQDFAPLDSAGTKNWIISRRLVVFPGEKILFFKASIYLGESKVMNVPYYSYSYQKRESILQQVRYTSTDGLLVDLPFYYRMADSGVGALKLRYAGRGDEYGGYFRPRKGMSLGLEQGYSVNAKSQGRFFLDAVGNPSQTLDLAHHLEFGSALSGGRADISARYQPSSTFAKGIYNTSVNVSGGVQSYNYSLSGYFGGSRVQQWSYSQNDGSHYVSQSDSSVRLAVSPRAPLFAKGALRATPSLTVGYGSLGFSPSGRASSCLYQSLGLGFGAALAGDRKASLSLDGSSSFTLTARGETGVSLRAGPSLRANWKGGMASLSYTLNAQAGPANTFSSLSRHSLGGNLFLTKGSKWSTSAFFSYGLDTGTLNLYSTAACNVANNCQLRTSYNLYRFAGRFNGLTYRSQSSYLKAGLYHPLGPYEIGLAWSPDGQDQGLRSSRRVWLEFGARGF